MLKCKKIIIIVCAVLLGLPLFLLALVFMTGAYLYFTADFLQPDVKVDLTRYDLSVSTDSLRICDDSSLSLNGYGLWEAHISGNPIERGAKYGLMTKDLLNYQEDVFVQQIHEFIPSEWWVEFLHKLIVVFNRTMANHVPEEYREELYAMSLYCSDKYDSYGPSYARQLNYHAAHDIGHAMQEYMLVGCSSFACWGEEAETGQLIVGRNFDFYVGDDFAKNKLILFVEPTAGYRFASISWPGMMGVLSGMNEKGLTVTINAAKGDIPVSSAMPISLLARHILQYSATIEEAYRIAQQSETFVSESLLIGSAHDGYAAIIEKTPEKTALYESSDSRIVCTNHYQSKAFESDPYNKENIATSDSPYRHERLNELLDESSPVSVDDAVSMLRNRHGIGHADIGLSNEKSINQFIAHHSVVFQPEELRFWVSTAPWQLGSYVCYDLNEIFGRSLPSSGSYAVEECNVGADSLAINHECASVLRYREQYKILVNAIDTHEKVETEFIDHFISNNPNYFQVYNLLGDYEASRQNELQAVQYWKKAVSLEIPRANEKDEIIRKIKEYDQEQ